MKKHKGQEIMLTVNNFIVTYSQFDLGSKYKVYVKHDEFYNYVNSFESITKAFDYVNKSNR